MSEQITSGSADDEQQIIDPANLRHYRTELPNLYDEFDLTPYEFRLLAHYVRRGNCYETTRKTGYWCGMSPAKVVYTRRKLVEKGLIIAEQTPYRTWSITLVDIWRENFIFFGTVKDQNGRLRGKRGRLLSKRDVYVVNDEKTNSLVDRLRRKLKNYKEEPYKELADAKTASAISPLEQINIKPQLKDLPQEEALPQVPPVGKTKKPKTTFHKETQDALFDELAADAVIDKKVQAASIKKVLLKILESGNTLEQVRKCFNRFNGLYYKEWPGSAPGNRPPKLFAMPGMIYGLLSREQSILLALQKGDKKIVPRPGNFDLIEIR